MKNSFYHKFKPLKRIAKELISIFKYTDWQHLEELPPKKLSIEVTNHCSGNCIFCAYQYQKRKKGFMTDEVFHKAIEEYRQMGGKRITFSPLVGDSLCDPDIINKIVACKGFERIDLRTNGILLYNFNPQKLLQSGIYKLVISTAPFKKEIFERLYRTKGYEYLLSGIKKVIEVNNQLHNPVKIEIAFRGDISEKEIYNLPDYKEHIAPILPRKNTWALVKGYSNWCGLLTKENLKGKMTFMSNMWYKRRPCVKMFNALVAWDGRVRMCECRFGELEDELFLGNIKGYPLNIKDYSLKYLWTGLVAEAHRRKLPVITCCLCDTYFPV